MTPMTLEIYNATWQAAASELMTRGLQRDGEVLDLKDLSGVDEITLMCIVLGGLTTTIMRLELRIRELEGR